MKEQPDDDLEVLTELARRRREAAQAGLAREAPDFILSIEVSEVMYTLRRKWIPLGLVDPMRLADRLKSAYALVLEAPDLAPLMNVVGQDTFAQMTYEERLQRYLKTDNPILTFTSGRLAVGKHDFVPISYVSVNAENIICSVQGVGTAAELLAAETFEALWESTGVARRWEEARSEILMIGHATKTKVDLGVGFHKMLHPGLWSLLESDAASDGGYAIEMGPQSELNNYKPGSKAVCAIGLEQLLIKINSFDTTSGRSWESYITVGLSVRNELGTGRVEIGSQLPYERHIELVRDLKAALM